MRRPADLNSIVGDLYGRNPASGPRRRRPGEMGFAKSRTREALGDLQIHILGRRAYGEEIRRYFDTVFNQGRFTEEDKKYCP